VLFRNVSVFWFFNFDAKDSHCIIIDPGADPQAAELARSVARCFQRRSASQWIVLDQIVPQIWENKSELLCIQKLLLKNSFGDFLVLQPSNQFLHRNVSFLKQGQVL
jgi:hypothetical protein